MSRGGGEGEKGGRVSRREVGSDQIEHPSK